MFHLLSGFLSLILSSRCHGQDSSNPLQFADVELIRPQVNVGGGARGLQREEGEGSSQGLLDSYQLLSPYMNRMEWGPSLDRKLSWAQSRSNFVPDVDSYLEPYIAQRVVLI